MNSGLENLDQWEKTILDPDSMFRLSEATEAIDKLIHQSAESADALWRATYLRYVLATKQDDPEQVIKWSAACEALPVPKGLPTERRKGLVTMHYHRAGSLALLGRWVEASDGFAETFSRASQAGSFSEDQLLGIQEKWAHALHEAGHYKQALEVNQKILKQGQKLFGPDSEKLLTVMTNSAENLYMLGQHEKCVERLGEAIELAQSHEDLESQFGLLFRIGSIMHELGAKDEAEAFFSARLEVAEAIEDDDMIAEAEADLERLETQ